MNKNKNYIKGIMAAAILLLILPVLTYAQGQNKKAKMTQLVSLNEKPGLKIRFLWWMESSKVVEGPYISGDYYTFSAKPGRKFVIVGFKFINSANHPIETPYFTEGTIYTEDNRHYPLWDSPAGALSEEYHPVKSTPREVRRLIGNSGGYEKLLPGETQRGRLAWEVVDSDIPARVANLSSDSAELTGPIKLPTSASKSGASTQESKLLKQLNDISSLIKTQSITDKKLRKIEGAIQGLKQEIRNILKGGK